MDTVSKEKRSEIMSKIRGKNTKPEKIVRSLLHSMGYRFRLHRKGLPGKPDIVLPKYKTVIFVHGCYWHRHPGCRKAVFPKTNTQFWENKFCTNVRRDRQISDALSLLGWKVLVVWECESKDVEELKKRLGNEI